MATIKIITTIPLMGISLYHDRDNIANRRSDREAHPYCNVDNLIFSKESITEIKDLPKGLYLIDLSIPYHGLDGYQFDINLVSNYPIRLGTEDALVELEFSPKMVKIVQP